MNRDASAAIVVGAIIVTVLVAIGLGLAGTTKTTTSSTQGGALPEPPSDSSYGVIYELQSTPGTKILSFRLRSPRYTVQVGLVPPPGCLSVDDSGKEEIVASGDCASLPAHGEVTGGGTTPSGTRLAVVSLDVSKQCFESLEIGEGWPTDDGACLK